MKRRLLGIAKIAVSLTILWLVLRRIDLTMLLEQFTKLHPVTIVGVFFLACIRHLTQYFNWRDYLKFAPNYMPKRFEMAKAYLAGLALRFLVPGGHATYGKALFVQQETKSALIAISLEKFTMFYINLLLASIAASIYYTSLNANLRLLIPLTALSLPFWLLLLKKRASLRAWIVGYKNRMGIILTRQMFYVFLQFVQFWLLINNFSQLSFGKVALGVPLVQAANLVPFTIAGLGVRETIAVNIFSLYKIGAATAIATSLTVFVFNDALPALLGIIPMVRKKIAK